MIAQDIYITHRYELVLDVKTSLKTTYKPTPKSTHPQSSPTWMCEACKESESPYERLLSPGDREAMQSYISSIIPNWRLLGPLEDLPAELRDDIFDHTLIEEEEEVALVPRAERAHGLSRVDSPIDGGEQRPLYRPPSVQGLTASVRNYADPNLLKVLRDSVMGEQLEKRAKRWKTLILRDSDVYNFEYIVVPDEVTGVLWLEVFIILFCHSCPYLNHQSEVSCRAMAEVSNHKSWIEDTLQQFTELRGFSIFVHLAHHDFAYGQKPKLPCEELMERKLQELTDLPKLKELKVYRYRHEDCPNFLGPKEEISRYRPTRDCRIGREHVV